MPLRKVARAKHDSLRAETEARLGHDARNAAVFDDQVINGLLEDAEVLLPSMRSRMARR